MKEGFTQSTGICLGLIYGMSIGIATHNIGFWLPILGIMPDFQGKGIGKKMIQSALELGRTKKMKACRFDALSSNLPAQKLYESLGFVFCGKQHWFANNTGWTDFYLYERKM